MATLKIDPQNITDFNRTDNQLEAFLLFSVAVAGKTAQVISDAIDRFLQGYKGSPFNRIRQMIQEGVLEEKIITSRLGKHRTLTKAFQQIVETSLDLKACSAEELEKIHGIGLKTSRFFLLHSRKNAKIAALDTHILNFMRTELGISTPKNTPASPQVYRQLEKAFINYADKTGKSVAEVDLAIWNKYSKGGNNYKGKLVF